MTHVLSGLIALLLVAFGPVLSYSAAQEPPQQKEQYERSMEERLRQLGKELDALKARAATTTETARKEMKAQLAEAEKKREAAFRKLESMRKASEKKWKKFSSQMNAAADEFEEAYERAKSHFKE